MDIVQELTTPEIQGIEQRICYLNGKLFESQKETEILVIELRHLMEKRKRIINHVFWQQEKAFLPDIVEFNEALASAFHETWNKVTDLHSKYGCEDIEASLWFGPEFPKKHPLAVISSFGGKYNYQELWEALTDPDAHKEYNYGIGTSATPLRLADETFEEFIGLSDGCTNWNEGLDQELTKDLHLILPFHTLYEHTSFAITDFIYVRDFNINVVIDVDFRSNGHL